MSHQKWTNVYDDAVCHNEMEMDSLIDGIVKYIQDNYLDMREETAANFGIARDDIARVLRPRIRRINYRGERPYLVFRDNLRIFLARFGVTDFSVVCKMARTIWPTITRHGDFI